MTDIFRLEDVARGCGIESFSRIVAANYRRRRRAHSLFKELAALLTDNELDRLLKAKVPAHTVRLESGTTLTFEKPRRRKRTA